MSKAKILLALAVAACIAVSGVSGVLTEIEINEDTGGCVFISGAGTLVQGTFGTEVRYAEGGNINSVRKVYNCIGVSPQANTNSPIGYFIFTQVLYRVTCRITDDSGATVNTNTWSQVSFNNGFFLISCVHDGPFTGSSP